MQYRRYRSDITATGVSSPDRIKGLEIPSGHCLEVTHMSGGVMASEQRVVELGYIDNTGTDKTLHMDERGKYEALIISGEVWLDEGDIPFVEITGVDSGSGYFLSIHGRLWPLEPEVASVAEVQRESDVRDDIKPQ